MKLRRINTQAATFVEIGEQENTGERPRFRIAHVEFFSNEWQCDTNVCPVSANHKVLQEDKS
jgi:hypothetical protein